MPKLGPLDARSALPASSGRCVRPTLQASIGSIGHGDVSQPRPKQTKPRIREAADRRRNIRGHVKDCVRLSGRVCVCLGSLGCLGCLSLRLADDRQATTDDRRSTAQSSKPEALSGQPSSSSSSSSSLFDACLKFPVERTSKRLNRASDLQYTRRR